MKSFLSAFVVVAFLSTGMAQAQQPGVLGVQMRDGANGVSVSNVAPDSAAARMGIQAGDRIVAINSNATANSADVIRMIGGMQAGTRVELTLARGDWQGRLNGTLAAAGSVFIPAPQFAPVSSPVSLVPNNIQDWSFPFNMQDNGSRGVAASYGGGGY